MVKRYSKFQISLWKHFGKYYIFYLINFNRKKLRKLLLARKDNGMDCRDCGLCCKNCPALDLNKRGFSCKLWEQKELIRCVHFPLHPIQLQIEKEANPKFKCRYSWAEMRGKTK